MIKRIKVHTLDALKDPAYRFPNNYGVEKYLELFSGTEHIPCTTLNAKGSCTTSLQFQVFNFFVQINKVLLIILFTEEDYDAFCLAYMFTYRDFEMGTLGLAWTGDLKNAGGVCEKNGVINYLLTSLI